MSVNIAALGLFNLDDVPEECAACALWGIETRDNIERLLREWGPCGFLAYEEKTPIGFALFGPGKYFPKSGLYPAGPVSKDAIFIACVFVAPDSRDIGIGARLLIAVQTEAVKRDFKALEAIAVRDGNSAPAVPLEFYFENGFYIVKDDRRHPRVRLDIGSLEVRPETAAAIFEGTPTWISPTNA